MEGYPTTFFDLFAGIGGFRIAFEDADAECIFSSEIDIEAQQTYAANFEPVSVGDITKVPSSAIPDHDILTAGFPCFPKGTSIVTNKGLVAIDSLKTGDLVYTHTGRYLPVINIMNRKYNGKMFVIGMPYGIPTIRVTPEHPFFVKQRQQIWNKEERKFQYAFTASEFIEVSRLTTEHFVGYPINQESIVPIFSYEIGLNKFSTKKEIIALDENFMFFVGFYVAEGWRSKRKKRNGNQDYRIFLGISSDEIDMVTEIVRSIGKRVQVERHRNETSIKIHILSKALWLFTEQFGDRAYNKTIPEWIHRLPVNLARAFVQGLITGDGYCDGRLRSLVTTSKELAYGFQRLITKTHNIIPSVRFDKRPKTTVIEGRTVNQRDCYHVRFLVNRKREIMSHVSSGYIWVKIKTLDKVQAQEIVFNLDVSEDNSYSLHMMSVHNCQPFSIAGISSRRSKGMPTGFDDQIIGTLFFEIARIIRDKQPRAFLLENVKNLKHHNYGNTYRIIIETLTDKLGYYVCDHIYDASLVVPQRRKRIFLAGFRSPRPRFFFPHIPDQDIRLRDILDNDVDDRYTLTDGLWKALKRHKERHQSLGHGFGYAIADPNGITRTMTARYYIDGAEILLEQEGKNPRRCTPRECCRLMGFPEDFKIPVKDRAAYKQFGNAVVPGIVRPLARAMVELIGRGNK